MRKTGDTVDTNANIWTKGGLGVWCRDHQGRSWIVERSDAVQLAVSMLAHSEIYQELRLIEFKKRLLTAIDLRQIVFFFDPKCSVYPVVIVTWAQMSKRSLGEYLKSGKLSPTDWTYGDEIGLIDVFHSSIKGDFHWIVQDLTSVIFPDVEVAYSRRTNTRGNSNNTFRTWKNPFHRAQKYPKPEPKFQLASSHRSPPPRPLFVASLSGPQI